MLFNFVTEWIISLYFAACVQSIVSVSDSEEEGEQEEESEDEQQWKKGKVKI